MTHQVNIIHARDFRSFVNAPEKKPPRKHPESDMQQACVKWFRHQYPQYRKLFFHPANGERRDFLTGQILNGQGVEPGVSDLILLLPRGGHPFFCAELKTQRNDLSKHQQAFRAAVESVGAMYEVIRSTNEFIISVNYYIHLKSST